MQRLEQVVGAAILAVALVDIFLTILYARLESGFLGMRVAHGVARGLVVTTRGLNGHRGFVISLGGPLSLVAMIALWFVLLTVGLAMVVHPALGTGIQSPGEATPHDFVTALYVAGASLSVVGSSGYQPTTAGFRLVFLVSSALGMSFTSLMVTYILQLYSALLRRNALALKVHAMTEDKGDGAELVARLGPRGHFDSSTSALADLAAEISHVKESHHFYPVLLYFRFEEPEYSVSRTTAVVLDAMSILMSSLDDDQLGWIAGSANVTHAWRSSIHMLHMLTDSVDKGEEARRPPSEATSRVWRRHYARALERLRTARIPVIADEDAGFARYAVLRARWDGHIRALAPELAFQLEQILPADAHAGGGRLPGSRHA